MALAWARQRQLNYILTVLGFFVLIGLVIFFIYKPAPSCFDGRQNQDEQGVDCGGVCNLACVGQIRPLKITWVRPLKVNDGWYDLVARVENLNVTLGNRNLPYTFSVYDTDNVLINTRSGATFVNPNDVFLIFESRVETGERIVGKVFLEFPTSTPWERVESVEKDIYTERREFTNEPRPTLHLSVGNSSLRSYNDIQVVTVLSDINNNTLAASKTIVDSLGPNSRQEVYFTWPRPFLIEPSYIDAYWRVNAFNLNQP
ncbi:MAG TPA: hypothetical protein P5274_00910 [Candidatus Paceibacterota bacterium]|nr:hypothetical protein [Candidatus Paceibacterota bacterium]